MIMKNFSHRILATTALCLAAVGFSVFGWAIFQLSAARVHTLGLDGKICPCELADIRQGEDGSYLLYMPEAVGQAIYVVPDSLGCNTLTAEAYVLPWFGRLRAVVNEDGYATVKISQ